MDGNSINYFNPHLANGPTCLMTRSQAIDAAQFAWPTPSNLTYITDEVCFSAAATSPLAMLAVLVALLVALAL